MTPRKEPFYPERRNYSLYCCYQNIAPNPRPYPYFGAAKDKHNTSSISTASNKQSIQSCQEQIDKIFRITPMNKGKTLKLKLLTSQKLPRDQFPPLASALGQEC